MVNPGLQALFDPSVDQRTFTLLSPECVTLWLIRSILRRLQTWAPGIRIQVERPSASALARLSQGNVDLLMAMDGPGTCL
jgi:DNA-binding transcriptional LysR family regulator